MASTPSIELHGPALSETPDSRPRPPLHQLPPPPGDFTGRKEILEDLVEKVRFDGVSIVGFFGMGGIGKSALGLKLAEELIPRYPDAQICLNMRRADGAPISPLEAMAYVIRTYDPGYSDATPEIDIDGHYRSVLNDKRAIILLDDVSDREQILRLIPPPECLLVITSRTRFTIPGLLAKDLNQLPLEEARDLLLRIAPRLDGQARGLATLCGCLPGALRKAANLLIEHRDLTVDNCMRRLSQVHERQVLVEDSIAPAYRALSPELQRLWRTLSVFPGGFACGDAGAIWGLSERAAQDFLSVLLGSSMLQWHEAARLYFVHDLLRLWALAQCTDVERQSAQRNLSVYGATVLSRVSELYHRGGESEEEGLALFDAERPNVEAGWAWASAHAEQDEWADQMCTRYPVIGGALLDIRQGPKERIQWLQAPLAAARRQKDQYAEACLLGDAGEAYCRMGDIQRGTEYYTLALTLSRETNAKKTEERSMRGLGQACMLKGEFPHALEYHEKALALAREINDRRGECECLRELAGDYAAMGAHRRAIEVCTEALGIARETGARCSEADCMGDLAAFYNGSGEPKRALELSCEALLIARQLRNSRSEESMLGTMGRSYAALGDTRRAVECHEGQLKTARDNSDRYGEGDALDDLGNALARSGDARRALECYLVLLKIVREIADRPGEAMVLGKIGRARARLGETRVAIECYSEQLQIAREIGDRHAEASALWRTSLALDKLGDRLQAITHANAARKIFKDTGDAECAMVQKQLGEWAQGVKKMN